MQRVAVHLTDEQIKVMRRLSKKTGLAFAELLRRALDAYLKAEENEKSR